MRRAAAALLVVLAACGGAATQRPAPATAGAPLPALHEGPLTDYVPAAGLRWMVVGKPKELAADAALARAVELLVPSVRLDAFARSTGVDLRATPAALVAGFDYGTLYVAAMPSGSVAVEELFAERIVSGAVRRSPDPRVHRVSGVIGRTPEAMVHIDGLLVAVSTGDPTPVRVVEAFARRKLARSKPALEGAALSTLPPELARAPFVFYAPGPFDREWLDGAHGLLGLALAVGVGVLPRPDGVLEVTIYLAGDWAHAGPDATARLLQTWEDLASGSLGHLTGLARPVAAPIVSVSGDALKLRVELAARPLAVGLRDAVGANITEWLGQGPPSAAPTNP